MHYRITRNIVTKFITVIILQISTLWNDNWVRYFLLLSKNYGLQDAGYITTG